ncbi:MAG: sigma-70 family RNA polymerase sigma factor [Verrucomicrobia bacterium]|nr:sigma-70 family RNA polymerase sigma factor [Verrucomicrobiota bacterium]
MSEWRADFELLQAFSRQGDQPAFATLTRRHLDLVYATALRKVTDGGAAEEICQNVFGALARKAWQFAPDDSLPSWLHRTTLLESKSWLRGELRRRRREATAAELGTTMKTSEAEPAFQALVPLLDEALLSLREKDRTALLLRFYESHSLREVGAAVGASEDAARMRVQSALEKLAEFFKRRGFKTATVAAAAAALQHTATSASAAVVSTVVGAVLKVAPPALVGLAAWLARLASLSRVQTAGQGDAANVQSEIERLRAASAKLEQSIAQANEVAARAAESAQAFEAWKLRTRGLLLAADYRWSDDSPFVRIPKAVLPELVRESAAEPFSPPGVVNPFARELMGMTPVEQQAMEAALGRHFADVEERVTAGIQETNLPVADNVLARRSFALSPLPEDEMRPRRDQILAEVQGVVGNERWPVVEAKPPQAGPRIPLATTGANLPMRSGESVEISLTTDAKGTLKVEGTFAGGSPIESKNSLNVVGYVNVQDLSMFLPEDHPRRPAAAEQVLKSFLPLVTSTLRQRVCAWLQEEAITRLSKKENP